MSDDQKRAFLAVVLSGVILFGWQYFFAPKNSPNNQNSLFSSSSKNNGKNEGSSSSVYSENTINKERPNQNPTISQEIISKTAVLDEKFQYTFTNQLGLLNAKSPTEKFTFNSILETENPLEIQIFDGKDFRTVFFEFDESASSQVLKGHNGEFGLLFTGEIQKNGKFQYSIISKSPIKIRFIIHSKLKDLPNRPSREFLLLAENVDRIKVGKEGKGEVSVKWFGVDFNYHLFAVTFKDKKSVSYNASEDGTFIVDTNGESSEVSGNILFVKKNYDDLVALGENLHLSVDFGILGVLAVPILRILQYLYNFFPNYGLAIILLTILMKIITYPLQHKSYKSMKKMQVIQPELAKLKEKFKDDPQRMQKESMELFKKAGANPLSGCLPLLLQTPIFFAFYKVLSDAVELVGAPFYGWISDLSLKDPFYILPVVMTVVMFVQQKLTPNTSTDPTQRKVMMFMPLIFGLIMKDLPSGLTLYILVSTVCGILQQLFVYKYSQT